MAALAAWVATNGASDPADRRPSVRPPDSYPTAPPVRVCDNKSLLGKGPSAPPKGGRKVNRDAFAGYDKNVTIESLTIQNFDPVGGLNDEGVVNHNAGRNWTVRNNTIRENAGTGLMVGTGKVVQYNC